MFLVSLQACFSSNGWADSPSKQGCHVQQNCQFKTDVIISHVETHLSILKNDCVSTIHSKCRNHSRPNLLLQSCNYSF